MHGTVNYGEVIAHLRLKLPVMHVLGQLYQEDSFYRHIKDTRYGSSHKATTLRVVCCHKMYEGAKGVGQRQRGTISCAVLLAEELY